MISNDEQYKYLTSQISHRVERPIVVTRFFVQTFSAIVGGSIYLARGAQLGGKEHIRYIYLSDAATIVLTLVCFVVIADARRSWYGYRRELTNLGGRNERGTSNIQPPSWIAHIADAAMALGIMAACCVFCWFNPVQSLP
jgi:hypothetical protein